MQVMYTGPGGPDSGEIDAAEYGSVARFFNHSQRPNCEFKRVVSGGLVRVLCCTARGVAEGEELTLNYGSSYWSAREGCLRPE
jgi:SET domain-containing protein